MKTLLLALAALLFPLLLEGQAVIYVDRNATGNRDGSSWEHAFSDLQEALFVAVGPAEIWVAQGVYRPAFTGRAASFVLRNGVDLYGGFAGTETDPAERIRGAHPTILSGDLQRDDATVGRVDNSYNVVTCPGVTAKLDGFTIRDGQRDLSGETENSRGVAIFGTGALTLIDCTFEANVGNTAVNFSGDLTCTGCHFLDNAGTSAVFTGVPAESRSTFTDCTFLGNARGAEASGNTGAIVTFERCSFVGNHGAFGGGAAIRSGSQIRLIVKNCSFRGNDTTGGSGGGGAVYIDAGGPGAGSSIIDSSFIGNRAPSGGAILIGPFGSNLFTISGCTFEGNRSDQAQPAAVGGGNLHFENCILWNNSANGSTSAANASVDASRINTCNHSLIQNLNPAGTGNLDGTNAANDPLFLSPVDPTTAPHSTGDVRLLAGSPALDAGDNASSTSATDVDGLPRIQNVTIDLGAHEGDPGPEIAVLDGAGNALTDGGAALNLGILKLEDGTATVDFTIDNSIPYQPLGAVLVSASGPNGGNVGVTTPPLNPVPAYAKSPFQITLTLSSAGAFQATLQIASNDPDENPFEIPLSAVVASGLNDGDDDGLSDYTELTLGTDPASPDSDNDEILDGTEVALAAFGFINGQDDSAKRGLLGTNAPGLGLYTESNLQALALGRPVLSRDATTGKFTLTTGLLGSPDLVTPFTPLTGLAPSYNPGTGEISIEFDPPAPNAYFFQVFGREPQP